jgi:hypothetical protein
MTLLVSKVPLQKVSVSAVQGKGRKGAEIAVPMELLSIKRGQKKTGLLIGDQQAKLVKIAAQRPEDKRRDIGTWIQKSSKGMAKSAQSFGIAVDSKPAVVNGRLLPAPVIEYAQPSHYYAGTTGAWNMKDVRMLSLSVSLSLSLSLSLSVSPPCTVVVECACLSISRIMGILCKCFESEKLEAAKLLCQCFCYSLLLIIPGIRTKVEGKRLLTAV